MNSSSKPRSPANREWWTRKRVACFTLVLAVTLYVLVQPKLEQWTGIDLPDIVERDEPGNANDEGGRGDGWKIENDRASDSDTDRFQLSKIGPDTFQSPAGLVYAMGPKGEHRIQHVMRHCNDEPSRIVHGVFNAKTRTQVLTVLDHAYVMIQSNSQKVHKQMADQGRIEYVIDFPKPVGFVGGKEGAKQGRPSTHRLKMILNDDRVVTAYPIWPDRRRSP